MATNSKRGKDVWVVNILGSAKAWVVMRCGEVLGDFDGPADDDGVVYKKQGDAVITGRAWAKAAKCELVVCGRNGKIRRKLSYGEDSPRRKG